MGHKIPCGLDDYRMWDHADANDAARQKRVEDYADNLIEECKNPVDAEVINSDNDLYDGSLLANMMVAIAMWSGRTDGEFGAIAQMCKLHNLLADAMHEIAEREVK